MRVEAIRLSPVRLIQQTEARRKGCASTRGRTSNAVVCVELWRRHGGRIMRWTPWIIGKDNGDIVRKEWGVCRSGWTDCPDDNGLKWLYSWFQWMGDVFWYCCIQFWFALSFDAARNYLVCCFVVVFHWRRRRKNRRSSKYFRCKYSSVCGCMCCWPISWWLQWWRELTAHHDMMSPCLPMSMDCVSHRTTSCVHQDFGEPAEDRALIDGLQ